MLSPPFCPNRFCRFHMEPPPGVQWYLRRGHYYTDAFGPVQRFTCLVCGQGFSEQTFRLDYYIKHPIPYLPVLEERTSGCGIRSIGRHLHASHQVILNRLSRLARQGIAMHSSITADLKLNEDLATDGFESFVGSQYHPNNIHLLVGSKSQMLYSFDYAHLRRKGRMTDEQRIKRQELEQQLIRRRVTIFRSFNHLADDLEHLLETSDQDHTTLYSDEHPEYARVLRTHPDLSKRLQEGTLTHMRFSSHLPRTRFNPLFPVNYLDRQIRKDLACHVRETMQFSRNTNNCLEHLAVYQLQHNYRKRFRINEAQHEERLHAQVAGVPRERIERELSTLFELRRFFSRVPLTFSQALVWFRMTGTIDRYDGGYSPIYVWM